MAYYRDLYNSGNTSGYHYFDGTILNLIPGNWTQTKLRDTADGEVITVSRGNNTVTMLIHRNGRVGSRDLNLDTIVVTIDQLMQFDDTILDQILPYEQVPGGRRAA